jgi:hypothetical protein
MSLIVAFVGVVFVALGFAMLANRAGSILSRVPKPLYFWLASQPLAHGYREISQEREK